MPVGSSTLNLVKGLYPDREYWDQFIEKDGVDVKIKGKYPKIKKLSPVEIELIEAIFKDYGQYDQWQLARISEGLPEWKNPHGSSLPIELPELLMFLEYSPEDAERITFEFQEESVLDNLFGA